MRLKAISYLNRSKLRPFKEMQGHIDFILEMVCRKFLVHSPFPINSHELGVEVVDPKKQLRVTSLGVVVAFITVQNP